MDNTSSRLLRVLSGDMTIWRYLDYLAVAASTHPLYPHIDGFISTLLCKAEFTVFCDGQIHSCAIDLQLIRKRTVLDANDEVLKAGVPAIEEDLSRATQLYERSTTLIQRFRASYALASVSSNLRRFYFNEEREFILSSF